MLNNKKENKGLQHYKKKFSVPMSKKIPFSIVKTCENCKHQNKEFKGVCKNCCHYNKFEKREK